MDNGAIMPELTEWVENDAFVLADLDHAANGSYKSFVYDATVNNSSTMMAKVVVFFRPHDTYTGQYGFDWIRVGDTGLPGDTPYKDIVGKHYTDATYTTVFGLPDPAHHILANDHSWPNVPGKFFKKIPAMYDALLRSFDNLLIDFKRINKGVNFLYPVPEMTMMPGTKAQLTLKVELAGRVNPKQITIKCKNKQIEDGEYFKFNHHTIPVKSGKYTLSNFLTIECKKPISSNQLINVYADDKLCGQLKMLANNDAHQRKIDVVIVPVITNIGNGDQTGKPVTDEDTLFSSVMHQALVVPNIDVLNDPLDTTGSVMSSVNGLRWKYAKDKMLKDNGDILKFLNDVLDEKYDDKYKEYYKLYMINETQPGHNGFAVAQYKAGVYFPARNKSTMVHELLHTMNVQHPFAAPEIEPDNKFTYEAAETNNIMDYSAFHTPNPLERQLLWKWQWKMINNKIETR